MNDSNNIPTLLGEALLKAIRQAVREEIQAACTIVKEADNNKIECLLCGERHDPRLTCLQSWLLAQKSGLRNDNEDA